MHHLAIGAREILREPWLAQDDDIDEGREHRESQSLKKPYRLSLLDCRNLSQGGQNLVRYLSIHVNDGNRLARFTAFSCTRGRRSVSHLPTQRKVGNIDLVLTQNCTHTPNDARNVPISHVDQIALQRRFHVNVINGQDSGSMAMQNCALDQVLLAAGFQKNGKHAAGPAHAGLWLARFIYAQAARGGDGGGIHQVCLLLQCLVKNSFNGGISYQLGFPLSNMAAVSNCDLLYAAIGSLGEKRTEAFGKHDIG